MDNYGNSQFVPQKDGVSELTDGSFSTFINKNKHVLVKVVDPLCGTCQEFGIVYLEIVKEMLTSSDVQFAQLDAMANSKSARKYEVEDFPTLLWFHNGKVLTYDGIMDKTEIITWVKIRADPDYVPPEDATLPLSSANFTEHVTADISLVMFYAPWCGHSKKMKPFLEIAAKQLKGVIPVYKIDATVEKVLAKKYKVLRYPQLHIFRKGYQFEYNGPKEDLGIAKYMNTQLGDASVYLKTLEQFNAFPSKEKITVIAYLDDNQPKRDMFHRIANKMRDDYLFGYIDDELLASEVYMYNCPSITVMSPALFPTDKGNQISTVPFMDDQKKVEQTITSLKLPLVGEYSERNSKYYKTKIPIIYFFYHTYKGRFSHWHQKIVKIAKDYKNRITFVLVKYEQFTELMQRYRHDDSKSGLDVGMRNDVNLFYRMPEFDYDEDEVRDFIQRVLKGKQPRTYKSKKLHPHFNPTELAEMNSDHLKQSIQESSKDKFIFFYANWCDKCRSVFKNIEKLAKVYAEVDRLVVAKFDCVENEIKDDFVSSEITHFPTILFVRANDTSTLIKYNESSYKIEDLMAFIKSKATVSLDFIDREEL